jgi:DNA polymerase III delta prime subunit
MKHAKYMPTEPSPQSIKKILEKGKHVILKGPPGTGKTHLAMETIREFIGETGAQLSIVRHQMTMFMIAGKRQADGGAFSLSRNRLVMGDLGTDNSFYPPSANVAYFKAGEGDGKSISCELFLYDEDKLVEQKTTYISTSFKDTKKGQGRTVQIRNTGKDLLVVWDLIELQRRIVITEEGEEKWQYHLYKHPPNSQIHKEKCEIWLKGQAKSGVKFKFPEEDPPSIITELAPLKTMMNSIIIENKDELFTTNSSVVWDIVQFHPTYSYSDFVRGVDPDFSDGEIRFSDQKRTFLKMCESAIQNPSTPHVLIVDEINRAALGSVFGELILGLEDEYKGIPILTGNGRRITIPKNLALLGTMNSSDRSIGVIDHALKRRFEWIDLPAVLESSDDSDVQLLKDLNDLLAPEVRKERGFGKWMIGGSGKCASAAFTIIPQLETLLREGELDSNQMKKAAEKISIWYESIGGDKYRDQISEFVKQHNPTWESIERSEVNDETPAGVKFYIQLPKNRINLDYPKATAIHNREENTWTVLKGSGICKPSEKFGAENKGDFKIIDELLEKKIIHLYDDHTGYFLKNWPAKSKSMAARIPKREQTTDGGKSWKTEDGTTYGDWLANLEVSE